MCNYSISHKILYVQVYSFDVDTSTVHITIFNILIRPKCMCIDTGSLLMYHNNYGISIYCIYVRIVASLFSDTYTYVLVKHCSIYYLSFKNRYSNYSKATTTRYSKMMFKHIILKSIVALIKWG